MSDAMSFGELGELHVELLPARTLLSLLHASGAGASGDPGTAGAKGQSISQSFFGIFNLGKSDGYIRSFSIGDASSTTKSS